MLDDISWERGTFGRPMESEEERTKWFNPI
jgi:hypothetical protein